MTGTSVGAVWNGGLRIGSCVARAQIDAMRNLVLHSAHFYPPRASILKTFLKALLQRINTFPVNFYVCHSEPIDGYILACTLKSCIA
jgi:hypothetical protein